jgi:hypothetical protein
MLVARNFSMARSFLNKKKNEIFAACLSRNFTGWGKTTSERFKRKFEQQGDRAKFSSKRAEVFFYTTLYDATFLCQKLFKLVSESYAVKFSR